MKKILFLLLLCSAPLMAQKTLLHCGYLINTENGKISKEMTVTVEANKITGVDSGYLDPAANDQVIDLKDKYVLPGLIDMHVHLESETGKDQAQRRMQYGPADVAYEAQKHAKTTLLAGFTTVRDLGGSGVNSSLRDAINRGWVDGPRILSAGKMISTTGGHGDPRNSVGPNYKLVGDRADGIMDSPFEARRAVRQRYMDGVDWIKITATGGVLSIAKSGDAPLFKEDELEALISTANDYGIKVAAHAHGAEGLKRALRAGVKTIEHGTLMDDEGIQLFLKTGAHYIPTIIAGKTVSDSAKIEGYYHPFVVKKALTIGPKLQNTFAEAYKAGVNIGFGTDAGVFVHGMNAKEFVYMTEAGMPIMEALKSATVTNSKILEMEEEIGTIEKGKFADIIAVSKNPEDEVETLMDVRFVMKDGRVYKNE